MASNGRGQMRPHSANRSPPFVVIGLLVVIAILGFNYWNIVSKNTVMFNDIEELSTQLRENTVKRLSVEKRHEALQQENENTKSECDNHRNSLVIAKKELTELRELSERWRSGKEECDRKLQLCESDKEEAEKRSKKTQENYENAIDLRNECKTELGNANNKIDTLEANNLNNVPSSKVNETRTHILSVVQQLYGGKALVELQKAGVDTSGITVRDDILHGNQQQDTQRQNVQPNNLQQQNDPQQPNSYDQNRIPENGRNVVNQQDQNNQQPQQDTQQNLGNQQDNTLNVQNQNSLQQNSQIENRINQLNPQDVQNQQGGNVNNPALDQQQGQQQEQQQLQQPQQGNQNDNIEQGETKPQEERNQLPGNQGNPPTVNANYQNQNMQQGNVGDENSRQGQENNENRVLQAPQGDQLQNENRVLQAPQQDQLQNENRVLQAPQQDQLQNENRNMEQSNDVNAVQQVDQNNQEQLQVAKPGEQQNIPPPLGNNQNQQPQFPPEEENSQEQQQLQNNPNLQQTETNDLQNVPNQQQVGDDQSPNNREDVVAPAGVANVNQPNVITDRPLKNVLLDKNGNSSLDLSVGGGLNNETSTKTNQSQLFMENSTEISNLTSLEEHPNSRTTIKPLSSKLMLGKWQINTTVLPTTGTNNNVVGNNNLKQEQTTAAQRKGLDQEDEEEENEEENNLIDIDNVHRNKNNDVEDENLRQDELQVIPNKASQLLPADMEKEDDYGDEIDTKNEDKDLRFQSQAGKEIESRAQALKNDENDIEEMRESMDRDENAQGPGIERDPYDAGDQNTHQDDYQRNQRVQKLDQGNYGHNNFGDDQDTQQKDFDRHQEKDYKYDTMERNQEKDTNDYEMDKPQRKDYKYDTIDEDQEKDKDYKYEQEKDAKDYKYEKDVKDYNYNAIDNDPKTQEGQVGNAGGNLYYDNKRKAQDYYNDDEKQLDDLDENGNQPRGNDQYGDDEDNDDVDPVDHYEEEDDVQ